MDYWVHVWEPGGGRGSGGKTGCGCLLCIAVCLLVLNRSGSWKYALAALFITLIVSSNADIYPACRVVSAVLAFVFTFAFVLKFNGGVYFACFAGLTAAGVLWLVYTFDEWGPPWI